MYANHRVATALLPCAFSLFISLDGGDSNKCHAQCTVDNTPDADGVIESRVSCADDASGNAAVAFDGQGRFIVTWQRPRPSSSSVDIWFRRIAAGGAALHGPFPLTDLGETVPNPDMHQDPSIDISADGRVVVG